MTDKSKDDQGKTKKDVESLEMNLDQFGNLKSSVSIDKLNAFLDENLEDKKLKEEQKKNKD